MKVLEQLECLTHCIAWRVHFREVEPGCPGQHGAAPAGGEAAVAHLVSALAAVQPRHGRGAAAGLLKVGTKLHYEHAPPTSRGGGGAGLQGGAPVRGHALAVLQHLTQCTYIMIVNL